VGVKAAVVEAAEVVAPAAVVVDSKTKVVAAAVDMAEAEAVVVAEAAEAIAEAAVVVEAELVEAAVDMEAEAVGQSRTIPGTTRRQGPRTTTFRSSRRCDSIARAAIERLGFVRERERVRELGDRRA
jgi:hypothetical protein